MKRLLLLGFLLVPLLSLAQNGGVDKNANTIPIIQIKEDATNGRLFLSPAERTRIKNTADSLKIVRQQLAEKAAQSAVDALKTKTDTLAGKNLVNQKVGQANDAINALQSATNQSVQGLNNAIGERVRKVDADSYYKPKTYTVIAGPVTTLPYGSSASLLLETDVNGNSVMKLGVPSGPPGSSTATTPADIGLDRVDNTKDIEKPVSVAQRNAIAKKADSLNVYQALQLKASATDLQTGLSSKPTALTSLSQLRSTTARDVYTVNGRTYRLNLADTSTPDDFGTVIVRANGDRYYYQFDGNASTELFGDGDATVSDSTKLMRALYSRANFITIPAGTAIKPKGLLTLQNLKNKTIFAYGAQVSNADKSKGTMLIQYSSNINIFGGIWGNVQSVTANGGGSQHAIWINQSEYINLNGIHIVSSPEMGVAIEQAYVVTVQNSVIENTFRDGVYSHASAEVKYLNNTLDNNKDDALSFHDYGHASERTYIAARGYKQASGFMAIGNTIGRAYQGIISVQGSRGTIANNQIRKVVGAGIAVWNRGDLYPDGDSRAKNWKIDNNLIDSAGVATLINGVVYQNTGQSTTGRAAISVTSTNVSEIRDLAAPKRSSHITVTNNKVNYSGALSFQATTIDTLVTGFNDFNKPTTSGTTLAGDAVEIFEVTSYNEVGNNIVRGNFPRGYRFNGVSGKIGLWQVQGYTDAPGLIVNCPNLTYIYQRPLTPGTNVTFTPSGNLPTDPISISAAGGSGSGSTDLSKVVQGTSTKRTTFTGDFNGVRPAGFENISTASLGGVADNNQQFLGINVPHENSTGDGGPWLWQLFRPITSKYFYFRNYFGQAGSYGPLGWGGADRVHTQSWFPVDTTMSPVAGNLLSYSGGRWTAVGLPTHTHSASDITSGVLAPARLGTGTPAAGKYPDGSGAWTNLPTYDGSETKLVQGSNVSVTGTGTPSNPYSISVATASKAVSYNMQSGTSYTLTEADNGKLIVLTNASAITLTLPAGLSTGWNCLIEQGGAGAVTWANASGVSNYVYPMSTVRTNGKGSRAAIDHRGSNVYYLNGQTN